MSSVTIFPWDDNFNTGLTLIDQQHQTLVELLNVLADHVVRGADMPTLSQVLDQLSDYAQYHFTEEERIWGQYFHGDVLEKHHRASHGDFIAVVQELKTQQNGNVPDLLERILAFLTRWLASHILERDRYAAQVVFALRDGMDLADAKLHAEQTLSGSSRVLIDIILSVYSTLSANAIDLMREMNARKKAHQDLLDFTEILSHHLQEPVRLQMLYASALEKACPTAALNDESRLSIRHIQNGAKRLRALLHDMEVYLSVSASGHPVENCDTDAALRYALQTLHTRIVQSQATITVTPLPPVRCQASALADLFSILLDNALTYHAPTQPPHIWIGGTSQANGWVRLWVEDRGIGIPEAYRQRVFQVFEQLEHRSDHAGTGIGLAVARKIVDASGGTIWIEPPPEGGTRICLALKAAEPGSDEHP